MIVALVTAHVCRPPLDKEYDACKASAAGMLAFRPHTRSELSTKLTDKGYDKACIERSISRLQELASHTLVPYTLCPASAMLHACHAPLRPVVPCQAVRMRVGSRLAAMCVICRAAAAFVQARAGLTGAAPYCRACRAMRSLPLCLRAPSGASRAGRPPASVS